MRVNTITMRDQFSGGSEFWWGDQGVVWVFLCKRLPELFTHTIVWVYWKPISREVAESSTPAPAAIPLTTTKHARSPPVQAALHTEVIS